MSHKRAVRQTIIDTNIRSHYAFSLSLPSCVCSLTCTSFSYCLFPRLPSYVHFLLPPSIFFFFRCSFALISSPIILVFICLFVFSCLGSYSDRLLDCSNKNLTCLVYYFLYFFLVCLLFILVFCCFLCIPPFSSSSAIMLCFCYFLPSHLALLLSASIVQPSSSLSPSTYNSSFRYFFIPLSCLSHNVIAFLAITPPPSLPAHRPPSFSYSSFLFSSASLSSSLVSSSSSFSISALSLLPPPIIHLAYLLPQPRSDKFDCCEISSKSTQTQQHKNVTRSPYIASCSYAPSPLMSSSVFFLNLFPAATTRGDTFLLLLFVWAISLFFICVLTIHKRQQAAFSSTCFSFLLLMFLYLFYYLPHSLFFLIIFLFSFVVLVDTLSCEYLHGFCSSFFCFFCQLVGFVFYWLSVCTIATIPSSSFTKGTAHLCCLHQANLVGSLFCSWHDTVSCMLFMPCCVNVLRLLCLCPVRYETIHLCVCWCVEKRQDKQRSLLLFSFLLSAPPTLWYICTVCLCVCPVGWNDCNILLK